MPGRLLDRLILLFILAGLVPLAARYWWPFELATHFRLQFLVPALALLVVAVILRRRLLGPALAAVIALNAWPVLPYLPLGGTVARGGGDEFVVLNLNVYADNTAHDRILAHIRGSGADLVTLIELSPALAAKLGMLADVYAHQFAVPADDYFGLAVLSRYPLQSPTQFELGASRAIETGIALPAASLRLFAAHPVPPTGAAMAAARNDGLEVLAARIRATTGPLVACGDFNLSPYSPFFTRFEQASGTRDVRRGRAPSFSWPSFLPLAGIPIDHCFVRGPLAVDRVERMEAIGSDHYPVRVTLRWQESR